MADWMIAVACVWAVAAVATMWLLAWTSRSDHDISDMKVYVPPVPWWRWGLFWVVFFCVWPWMLWIVVTSWRDKRG